MEKQNIVIEQCKYGDERPEIAKSLEGGMRSLLNRENILSNKGGTIIVANVKNEKLNEMVIFLLNGIVKICIEELLLQLFLNYKGELVEDDVFKKSNASFIILLFYLEETWNIVKFKIVLQ